MKILGVVYDFSPNTELMRYCGGDKPLFHITLNILSDPLKMKKIDRTG